MSASVASNQSWQRVFGSLKTVFGVQQEGTALNQSLYCALTSFWNYMSDFLWLGWAVEAERSLRRTALVEHNRLREFKVWKLYFFSFFLNMYSYVSNPPAHFFHLAKVLFFRQGCAGRISNLSGLSLFSTIKLSLDHFEGRNDLLWSLALYY